MKILIADDEINIREVVKTYGNVSGYQVFEASDGKEAIELCSKEDFDLVILDLMMPNIDGFTACKYIKQNFNIPVIMLSARIEESDKLLGFELGIDDYVTKPFSPKELMARIKVVTDRYSSKDIIKNGAISINTLAHEVTVDGETIKLTNKEYDLLSYLAKNINIALSREQISKDVWGYDYIAEERTIDTHVKMLRNKLGKHGDAIITVRGIGYKFNEIQ